jgi:hypothetical protein
MLSVRFYAQKEHARSLFRCVYLPLAVEAMILKALFSVVYLPLAVEAMILKGICG